VSTPVDTAILQALAALLRAAATTAQGVHVSRGQADPFEPAELPAINLLTVEASISTPSRIGYGAGVPVLQVRQLDLVVQVITRGGASAEDAARLIGARCEAAIAADPLLGGVCSQAVTPQGTQWLRDDEMEQHLARQNTLYRCEYRTYSNDPFTPV
jgi:hypothetical protein